MNSKLQRHLARQALLRGARFILGDGNGDQSCFSRGSMFENRYGMPMEDQDLDEPPAAACMLGSVMLQTDDSLVRDEAVNMLAAAVCQIATDRGFRQRLFTGREIAMFNDEYEYCEDAADAAGVMKQAATGSWWRDRRTGTFRSLHLEEDA